MYNSGYDYRYGKFPASRQASLKFIYVVVSLQVYTAQPIPS